MSATRLRSVSLTIGATAREQLEFLAGCTYMTAMHRTRASVRGQHGKIRHSMPGIKFICFHAVY